MVSEGSVPSFSALDDFYRLRRRADLEKVLARLRGRSADLLAYDEVRRILRVTDGRDLGLREISLDAIVGSVGRYADFTRTFLPLQQRDAMRWARVNEAATSMAGLPPIEVYQIGEVYFVRDGNHRVSVARRLGATHIQAYVYQVHSRVALTPDVQPDELIVKAEQAAFLEHTGLDRVRPESDVSLTAAGQYGKLREHIDVHRYFMGLDLKREVPYEEAVGHWYDEVYLPVVLEVREQGLLRHVPGRTEADLYLWAADHRAALEESLGWEIGAGPVLASLADEVRAGPQQTVARAGERLRDMLTPDVLDAGPVPGQWREGRSAAARDCLFADVLVPVSGNEKGWYALEQAIGVARREGGRLMGLHVVRSKAAVAGEPARAVQAEFHGRCERAGVPGRLAVEAGPVARRICERARWADLVVVNLAYPPAAGGQGRPAFRLSSGFRTLLGRCPVPILAVPQCCSQFERGLLAYDGSPKGREALYVAAYLSGRWGLALTVVTVPEGGRVGREAQAQAREYLEARRVTATFREEAGPPAQAIRRVAEAEGGDLILMGGYGLSPIAQLMLGSTVDWLLRDSPCPLLICR